MGNGYRGCGPHGAIGYRGYPLGYRGMGIWGNRVQGYGVQDIWATWAMGTGVWGILGHVYPLTHLDP